MPCAKGWRPDEDMSTCVMIRIEYLLSTHTEAIVAIALCSSGTALTIWILVIFLRNNNTAVVKASTRELSYIIIGGIFVSFACNFVLVAKPSIVTCYFSRVLPGLSFSLIYGALLTKTNRIARILEGSKKIMTKKPRFMSASAQVVITFIIIGVECAIITIMLIIEPADSTLHYPSQNRVLLVCNTSTMGIVVPLGFDLTLILMCTLYAIKTRNLPENFNEAKFIGFTMYTTCVIWLGFVPIYFGSENKVITLCISISSSALVALVLLFFPKIYIIIWAPERNTRSAFTTSKDVRCHIGSQLSAGRSSYSNSNDSLNMFSHDRKDKSAVSAFRQKTFLDKWRHKTRSGVYPGNSYRGRMSVPNVVYRYSRSDALPANRHDQATWCEGGHPRGGKRGGCQGAGTSSRTGLDVNGKSYGPGKGRSHDNTDQRLVSIVETQAVHSEGDSEEENRSQNGAVIFHRDKAGILEMKELSTISSKEESSSERSHKSGSRRNSRKLSSNICLLQDNSCQTGDELMTYLLPDIRRRIGANITSGNSTDSTLSCRGITATDLADRKSHSGHKSHSRRDKTYDGSSSGVVSSGNSGHNHVSGGSVSSISSCNNTSNNGRQTISSVPRDSYDGLIARTSLVNYTGVPSEHEKSPLLLSSSYDKHYRGEDDDWECVGDDEAEAFDLTTDTLLWDQNEEYVQDVAHADYRHVIPQAVASRHVKHVNSVVEGVDTRYRRTSSAREGDNQSLNGRSDIRYPYNKPSNVYVETSVSARDIAHHPDRHRSASSNDEETDEQRLMYTHNSYDGISCISIASNGNKSNDSVTDSTLAIYPGRVDYSTPDDNSLHLSQDQLLHADSEISKRLSALSSSTCSHISARSAEKSLEDMSIHGLHYLDDEESSMQTFHDYMKDRGVEIDLSSVQSSDV